MHPGYSAQAGYPAYGNPGQPAPNGYAPGHPYGVPGQQYAPQPTPFASWGSRVGAYLIDVLIGLVPLVTLVGLGIFIDSSSSSAQDTSTSTSSSSAAAGGLMMLGFLISGLFALWNVGARQGKTGQSIGKKALGIMVVDERTGRPAGAGAGLGRYFVQVLIGLVGLITLGILPLLNDLWPLWDDKKQALHDKIVHTLVVQGPKI